MAFDSFRLCYKAVEGVLMNALRCFSLCAQKYIVTGDIYFNMGIEVYGF